MKTLRWPSCAVSLLLAGSASAQDSQAPVPSVDEASRSTVTASPATIDARVGIPSIAFAYTAHGTTDHTAGVQLFSTGLVASAQDPLLGGGATAWVAPVERLTLILDARSSLARQFSPSAAAVVRLYGRADDGFSLGALGKFKIDGFAAGPDHDEVESEAEIGLLTSYRGAGWVFDVNAIAGRGLGDDGETDAEGRLRMGRDVGSSVRVGIDGQARVRLSGPRELPNGRTWDFAAGPQLLVSSERYFGSLTLGPSTMGLVSQSVGWFATLSLGGTSF